MSNIIFNHLRLFALCVLFIAPSVKMVGLLVPLYIYPGSTWNTLINIKTTYPALPIIAVINPGSGPGTAQNSDYVSWIAKLQAANILVLGYDHTSYGARPTADVKADIDRYLAFYPSIDGIFFDEMSYLKTGNESYYSTVSNYAKGKGFPITIGNPGATLPPSYLQTVDYVVISESKTSPELTSYGTYASYMSRLVMITINQATLPTTWVNQAAASIGWIYVTSDTLPNPYDTLPSYLTSLATLLNNANANVASKVIV